MLHRKALMIWLTSKWGYPLTWRLSGWGLGRGEGAAEPQPGPHEALLVHSCWAGFQADFLQGPNPFTLLPYDPYWAEEVLRSFREGFPRNFSHERKSAGTHVHWQDNNSWKYFKSKQSACLTMFYKLGWKENKQLFKGGFQYCFLLLP